jgi:hypothetical protein
LGGRSKSAFVQAALYHDDITGIYSVEFVEWRRGSHAKLSAFLEIGPFGPSDAELSAATTYLESALKWLVGDAVELDRSTML